MIAYYYGQTGFACVIYYRRYLFKSVKNFFFVGLLPLVGGLILAFIFVWSIKDMTDPDYEDPPTSWLGVSPVLWLGLGTLLAGHPAHVLVEPPRPRLLPGPARPDRPPPAARGWRPAAAARRRRSAPLMAGEIVLGYDGQAGLGRRAAYRDRDRRARSSGRSSSCSATGPRRSAARAHRRCRRRVTRSSASGSSTRRVDATRRRSTRRSRSRRELSTTDPRRRRCSRCRRARRRSVIVIGATGRRPDRRDAARLRLLPARAPVHAAGHGRAAARRVDSTPTPTRRRRRARAGRRGAVRRSRPTPRDRRSGRSGRGAGPARRGSGSRAGACAGPRSRR